MLLKNKEKDFFMKKIIITIFVFSGIFSSCCASIIKEQFNKAKKENVEQLIEREIGYKRFLDVSVNDKKKIARLIEGMTLNQQDRFFESFKFHYTKIDKSRKKDTVSINLSTISYHNASESLLLCYVLSKKS